MKLPITRTCVVVKDKKALQLARDSLFCRYIIKEESNNIILWQKLFGKWQRYVYAPYGELRQIDTTTTGHGAYMSFYNYVGKKEVERMKRILKPIEKWESYEQMHFFNKRFVGEKIYQTIYELDANSAFTYGVLQLPDGFAPLKDYFMLLYNKKKQATNKVERSKYKNLQNYLVGYFNRIKEFVAVRSAIIRNSNYNIMQKMGKVKNGGGITFLSNTDSIVTNEKGFQAMQPYISNDVGMFKVKKIADRLFYNSSNSYQIGDKVTYSGVPYFARQNTDFFKGITATQKGRFIQEFDIDFEPTNENMSRLCKIRHGYVEVNVFNDIGENVETKIYTLKGIDKC